MRKGAGSALATIMRVSIIIIIIVTMVNVGQMLRVLENAVRRSDWKKQSK